MAIYNIQKQFLQENICVPMAINLPLNYFIHHLILHQLVIAETAP